MKTFLCILSFFCFGFVAFASDPFIKTIDDPHPGSRLRIEATPDNGYVVFSMDSVKLYKFDECGVLEWTKKYDLHITPWNSNAFIGTKSGGFAFMTRIQINPDIYNTIVTKLDASGNIIWSRIVGDLIYTHFPYTLSETNTEDLILYGNVQNIPNNTHHNMIVKINSAGNIIQTKFYSPYGGIWGGAIVTEDNGVLARAGSTFIKTDQTGNVQWVKHFQSNSTYGYYAPIEVDDGFIFTSYNNPGTSYINFHKMDKQGNLVWTNYKRTSFIGTPPPLRKMNNGNLICAFNESLLEFDKDFNIIKQSSINTAAGYYGKDICITQDGSPVMTGFYNNIPFIAKLDAQYNFTCNFPPAPFTITTANMTEFVLASTFIDYTMSSQNYSIPVIDLNFSQNRLCDIPKSLDLGNDTILCAATSILLNNKTGDTFDNYLWSTGETTPAITINAPGTYWLRVDYNCGEDVIIDTITIDFYPAIEVNLGDDLLECDSVTAVLIAPPCTTCDYTWSTGDTNNIITVKQPGHYWLTVKDSIGCIYTDTINVDITKCQCYLYVPSAFTPNNDGSNDQFIPVFYCDMEDYSLQIFNRWGDLVFKCNDYFTGWNGKYRSAKAPADVYVYRLEYIPFLKNKQQQKVVKMGTVMVIY